MITVETPLIYINTEQVYGGLRVYRNPISLPALMEKLMGLGVTRFKYFSMESGQRFGVLLDFDRPEERDSIYYYDSEITRRLLIARFGNTQFIRGLLEPVNNKATFEAELRHASNPQKRELIVCTNRKRFHG